MAHLPTKKIITFREKFCDYSRLFFYAGFFTFSSLYLHSGEMNKMKSVNRSIQSLDDCENKGTGWLLWKPSVIIF